MLWREQGTPYGPVHVCLSVVLLLGTKQPPITWDHCWHTLLPQWEPK
jgi:hypothetical protein